MITLPKIEYLNMYKNQKELKQRLDFIEKMIIDVAKDEVNLLYANKLKKISVDMDNGRGIKFTSIQKVKNHLNNL